MEGKRRIDAGDDGNATTCVGAVVVGRHVSLLHIGDSRAYVVRHDRVRAVTTDHTLVAKMVAAGRITAAEAVTHPHAGLMLRCVAKGMEAEYDSIELDLAAGERLLLCTDGVFRTMDDASIGRILGAHPSIRDGVAALHDAALLAGARDNLTILLVDPERSPSVV